MFQFFLLQRNSFLKTSWGFNDVSVTQMKQAIPKLRQVKVTLKIMSFIWFVFIIGTDELPVWSIIGQLVGTWVYHLLNLLVWNHLRLPAAIVRQILSTVAKNSNSTEHFVNLNADYLIHSVNWIRLIFLNM